MSNERFQSSFGKFNEIVNAIAVTVTISLIGFGYFQAVGSLAGVA